MRKRIVSLLMALVMAFSLIPTTVFAADTKEDAGDTENEFRVVISIEGLTLGQGLYVEPKAYTLDEINTLLAKESYGPYTEDELTAGMATLAMLIDNGLEYTITGDWESSAYLAKIKGLDNGTLDIPAIITENGGPSNEENDGNDDEYLGEYDYSNMSGWMVTVNDFMIDVGCASWLLTDEENAKKCQDYGNTYVIRWQFTLYGYGADLGVDTGWGMPSYFEGANRGLLYTQYALSTDTEAKAEALSVMENLTATQEQVDEALAALKDSSGTDPVDPVDPVDPTDPTDPSQPDTPQDVSKILNDTMDQLAKTVTAPKFGTLAGEWTVLSLARGGYYASDDQYFTDYYNRIVDTVNETAAKVDLKGALHKAKSTENSRLILALSSIGKDATSVGKWDLVEAYSANGFEWITKQGINGPIFALLALDSHDYTTTDTAIRQQCIDYILDKEISGGGWALFGNTADPDITAMALQALAKYKDRPEVKAAAERAFTVLSNIQQDNGGYASWGSVNSESIAQVIVATTAWGIDPDTDSRFVKNGKSAVDALLTFYVEDEHGFAHVLDGNTGGEVNAMATDQACYALVAYDRFLKGSNALYNMNDAFKCATHDFGEWTVTKKATCTEKGAETRTCKNCQTTESRDINATGHSFGEWTTAKKATCTEKGSQTRTCSACQATETQDIAATGHSFGKWVVTKAATRTEKGLKTRTCSVCNATETQVIPALGSRPSSSGSTSKPAEDVKSSKTGDNSQMTLWMGGVLLSAAALVVLNRKKKNGEA